MDKTYAICHKKRGLRTYTDSIAPDQSAYLQSDMRATLPIDMSMIPYFTEQWTLSVSLRSDCADVQADKELHGLYMSKDPF